MERFAEQIAKKISQHAYSNFEQSSEIKAFTENLYNEILYEYKIAEDAIEFLKGKLDEKEPVYRCPHCGSIDKWKYI